MNGLAFPVILAVQLSVELREGWREFRFEQIKAEAPHCNGGRPAVHLFGAATPEKYAIFHVADGDGVVGKIKQRGLFGESGGLLLERFSTVSNAHFQIGV